MQDLEEYLDETTEPLYRKGYNDGVRDFSEKIIDEIQGQLDFNETCDGRSDLGSALFIIKKCVPEFHKN